MHKGSGLSDCAYVFMFLLRAQNTNLKDTSHYLTSLFSFSYVMHNQVLPPPLTGADNRQHREQQVYHL